MKFNNEANKTFSTGKCKNNDVPKHFHSSKEVKVIEVNGKKVNFISNSARTIYIVFQVEGVWLYTADKTILESKKLTDYVKPEVKVEPKREAGEMVKVEEVK
jgi:hypothetical protein